MIEDEYKSDNQEYKQAVSKTRINLTKLYKILWEQCDPIMQNKIEAEIGYNAANSKKSVIE